MAKKAKKIEIASTEDLGNGLLKVTYTDDSVAYFLNIPNEAIDSLKSEDEDEDSEDEDEDSEDEDEDSEDEDEDSEDEDEDEDSEDEDEDEEITGEQLNDMDFEELEDICDDKELDTDPDDFSEKTISKLRSAIAKELGIKLPKSKK